MRLTEPGAPVEKKLPITALSQQLPGRLIVARVTEHLDVLD